MKLVDDKIISQTSQLPIVVILSLLALPLHQPPSLHSLSQMSIYGVSVSSVDASQLSDPPPVATPASNTHNTLPTLFINFQMLHFLGLTLCVVHRLPGLSGNAHTCGIGMLLE